MITYICLLFFLFLLDFIYRGSLFSIFTTLIYHKVLINNKTEQDTEQDKQIQILVELKIYISKMFNSERYGNFNNQLLPCIYVEVRVYK